MKKHNAIKRIGAMLIACTTVFGSFSAVYAENLSVTHIYVAPNGTGDGSIASPLGSLKMAVSLAEKTNGTAVVELREGTYRIDETIEITGSDVVIRSCPGENALITGGHEIPFDSFEKCTDEEFLGKLSVKSAKDKVVCVDMEKLGITDLGEIKVNGYMAVTDRFGYAPTLSYEGSSLTLARYPNEGYLTTATVYNDGSDGKLFEEGKEYLKEIEYGVSDSRLSKWSWDDVWNIGYFTYDWAESTTPTSFNKSRNSVISYTGTTPVSDRRVYFTNVPEELDADGEWYLDRNSKILYLIPSEDMKSGGKLLFTADEHDFFNIKNASNIRFEKLEIAGTTATAVNAGNSTGVVIDHSEISNIGNTAVKFTKCSDSGVSDSYLHDLGSWGIYFSECGDREKLVSSDCFVKNCEITKFSQYRKTYSPAVQIDNNVGVTVSNCKIYNAPHFAIRYEGNDCIIEKNEFYDLCLETADSGAVYTGRRWDTLGNEVRYNYFHDLDMKYSNTGMELMGVYLDDTSFGTNIHSNLFYRVDSVALLGGGRYNNFSNNIMVDCKKPLVFDDRALSWCTTDYQKENLMKMPYKTGVWAEKYPFIVNVLDDEPEVPKYNTLTNNILCNTPEFSLTDSVKNNSTVENNISISNSEFEDYRNRDFRIKDGSKVFELIPEFKNLPFGEMGLKNNEYVDNYPVDAAEVPSAPAESEIKVIVNGKSVEFDVAPTIINDRTMVPLRAIFEVLGADVSWDDATKTITAVKDDTTIKMQIGNSVMKKNGEDITLDSVPAIIGSRTLVPVRAIAEAFGSDVSWEDTTKTVIVKDAGTDGKTE